MDYAQLAEVATLHAPATLEAIQAAEATLGCQLPPDYVALLLYSDGLEPHHERYSLSLFATTELAEMNSAYEVPRYLPSLLCIGFDGGGRGIFLRCGATPGAVYLCGMGALDAAELRLVAPDLRSWVGNGFDLNDPPARVEPAAIDVYLVAAPRDGLKGLYRLTQALNLTIPVSEMRGVLNQLPYRLLHRVPYVPYARLCAELNAHEPCVAVYEADTLNARK